MIILIYIRNVKLFNLNHHIYVSHRMGTISLCVVGLPICEFLPVPAHMRTGSPQTSTAIGSDPHMQTFAYGDRISNFPYAHEHIMHTVRD